MSDFTNPNNVRPEPPREFQKPPGFLENRNREPSISHKASIHFDPNIVLKDLERLIENPPALKVGAEAARYMDSVTETVASDIEKLAQEHVDRALALQNEANTFAAMVRERGALLRQKIEREATQGFQLSKIMTSARQLLDA